MSPREKKLLVFFAMAGFVLVNFLGFSQYQSFRVKATREYEAAQMKLKKAELYRQSQSQALNEMEWLKAHEKPPMAIQEVQSMLQKFCTDPVTDTGPSSPSDLLIDKKSIKIGEDTERGEGIDDMETTHYQRAKIQLKLTGSEKSLYEWLDKINDPAEFRIATRILMSPNKDDTKIDCQATIEQWFVPLVSSE